MKSNLVLSMSIKMSVRNLLPAGWWIKLKRILYFPVDMFSKNVEGKRPPEGMNFVGSGDFEDIGEEFLRYFIDICGLKKNARVLDIGCGIGRMALPLTGYLEASGRYDGIDIVPQGIKWCKDNISPQFANFHFELADVYNKEYNPKGTSSAAEYHLPYVKDTFDFCFLTSVFTHMVFEDMENYLKEISRVLKPGGRCLLTYYLLNEFSLEHMKGDKSRIDFKHTIEKARVADKRNPEYAIAFYENDILELLAKYGLKIDNKIFYGAWCGREDYLSVQDILVVRKI